MPGDRQIDRDTYSAAMYSTALQNMRQERWTDGEQCCAADTYIHTYDDDDDDDDGMTNMCVCIWHVHILQIQNQCVQ